MRSVFKREFKSYFYSPLGYVFVAAYYLFTGFFFFNYNLYGNTSDMRALFSTMFTVTLFLVPILTMRMMSEDRKMKTDQILMMAPVGTVAIVLGKLFAALCVYLIAMSSTMLVAVVLQVLGRPEWPVVIGHFIGLFLLGGALICIGMFISSLTENQIIAAIGGFCVGFFMMLLDSIANIVSVGAIAVVLKILSFQTRYQPFTLGILGAADIMFFASIGAFFVFLTISFFEKRRWD